MSQRKLIVAGLVLGEDRILVTRRRVSQLHGGYWEFPGGKLELGESPESGLARELREEIAVEVEVGRIWDVLYHQYDEFEVVMLIYLVRIIAGTPECREVADMRWLRAEELTNVDMLPADVPLTKRLFREGIPQFV